MNLTLVGPFLSNRKYIFNNTKNLFMKKNSEFFKRIGGKGMLVYYGAIIILVAMVIISISVYIYNINKPRQNFYAPSTNSESDKISTEYRRKKENELYDKYEKIINQNRYSFLRTIELLMNAGFSLSQTERLPGGAVMHHYSTTIDNFEILVTYLDSPNPQYSEITLVHVKDLQKK